MSTFRYGVEPQRPPLLCVAVVLACGLACGPDGEFESVDDAVGTESYAQPLTGTVLQAEAMTLQGYQIENNAVASGGRLVRVPLGSIGTTGKASFTYTGASGTYDIRMWYFDENDGDAPMRLYVNGVQRDAWIANANLGDGGPVAATRTSRTKTSVSLASGDVIRLEGVQNGSEWARFDNVEILPNGTGGGGGGDSGGGGGGTGDTLINVNAATSLGAMGRQASNFDQARQNWIFDPFNAAESNRVRAMNAKLLRIDAPLHIVSTADGVYDFSLLDADVENVKATGAQPVLVLNGVPAWLADKSYGAGGFANYPYRTNPPTDLTKWQKIVHDTVYHLNSVKHYGIKYFLVWNEPNCCDTTYKTGIAGYEALYKASALGVKAADPTAKVGGPTTSGTATNWLSALASFAKTNNLPLDVVDWHHYQIADRPAVVKSQAAAARSILASYGFTSTALWLTEWAGTQITFDPAGQTKARVDRAAGVLGPMSYFLINENIEGFYFRLKRPTPDVLGIFQDNSGAPYPNSNVFRMIGQMASTRVTATSAMDANGLGVGALASKDAAKVTVLAWNYQNLGTASHVVTVTIANMPSSFAGKNIRLERYLVDANTSNLMHDASKSELQKVEDRTLPAATSPNVSFSLMANAVSQVVLTVD
jgi:hypothetical protein